jgi:hypothetical protein
MSIQGLREARPPRIPKADPQPAPAPAEVKPTHEPSPFAKLVAGLGDEVNKGERTMMQAIHGGGAMGPEQLLALQAGVYRYSEAVDLAAKLVDRASNGLKTVVQGQ